jgi:hypothetical protein
MHVVLQWDDDYITRQWEFFSGYYSLVVPFSYMWFLTDQNVIMWQMTKYVYTYIHLCVWSMRQRERLTDLRTWRAYPSFICLNDIWKPCITQYNLGVNSWKGTLNLLSNPFSSSVLCTCSWKGDWQYLEKEDDIISAYNLF